MRLKNCTSFDKLCPARLAPPPTRLGLYQVLDGVMFNKDVTHSKMRRKIENPRILLLDCPLEYKKGEVRSRLHSLGKKPTYGIGG